MSAQYPNSGAMYQNDRQRPGKKDPDRNGQADITCPHCQREASYWLSGWLKESAKGKFLSIAFKPKDAAKSQAPATSSPPTPPPQDDDVPF